MMTRDALMGIGLAVIVAELVSRTIIFYGKVMHLPKPTTAFMTLMGCFLAGHLVPTIYAWIMNRGGPDDGSGRA